MGQPKAAKAKTAGSAENLRSATDMLSALLAQQVRALAQGGEADSAALMKGMKEATAVLKDLAAVAKTLNEQGTEAAGAAFGVVVLPAVESEQK